MTAIREISCDELRQLLARNPAPAVVDVREEDEFADARVPGARNVPLSGFAGADLGALLGTPKETPLYVFCRSGNRSMKACHALQAAGFTDLCNVAGGILAWQAAGFPVQRG